jgi:pimeloyl-ACP methyl ester carboxylesterase
MDRIRMVPVSDDATGEGYVTVGDQLVWHQVHGSGDSAVVLLHGGFAGASSWGAQVPALVDAGFRVYVPERRGHGHTADVEGPMTYASMASDTSTTSKQSLQHLPCSSDGAMARSSR